MNLVFFDEVMKTVPPEHSATFISVDQSAQHLLAMTAPLLSTALSGHIGIASALWIGAGVRLLAFGLFLSGKEAKSLPPTPEPTAGTHVAKT